MPAPGDCHILVNQLDQIELIGEIFAPGDSGGGDNCDYSISDESERDGDVAMFRSGVSALMPASGGLSGAGGTGLDRKEGGGTVTWEATVHGRGAVTMGLRPTAARQSPVPRHTSPRDCGTQPSIRCQG